MINHDEGIYRQLQQHLDRLPAGFPKVESGLDIRLLKRLFTPEEAQLATALSLKPETLGKIHRRARKMGFTLEKTRELLDRMAKKGTILTHLEGYKEKHYSNASFSVGGIYNYQVDRLSPDLIKDYWQYQAEARSRARSLQGRTTTPEKKAKAPARKMLPLRTVPVEKSLSNGRKRPVGNYDDIRKIIQNVPGPIAVANCICRQSTDILGTPCKVTDLRETCLIIGPDHARRHVEMGIGRFISQDEALEILDQAQSAGLILQPENSRKPEAICCCCGDCCVLLKQLKRAPRPADLFITNYYIEVDTALCNGCGACVDRCQLAARELVENVSTVKRERCIGCGNCVPVCPTGANRLLKKASEEPLFKDKDEYYMTMLASRVGRWGYLKIRLKMLLGMRV